MKKILSFFLLSLFSVSLVASQEDTIVVKGNTFMTFKKDNENSLITQTYSGSKYIVTVISQDRDGIPGKKIKCFIFNPQTKETQIIRSSNNSTPTTLANHGL
ncbi:hypothetical protein K9K77_01795 [Candidatus Babeliales bacterium]|nr:hypothetical protein [Candidatus Babeliales bacterium]